MGEANVNLQKLIFKGNPKAYNIEQFMKYSLELVAFFEKHGAFLVIFLLLKVTLYHFLSAFVFCLANDLNCLNYNQQWFTVNHHLRLVNSTYTYSLE